MRQIFILPLVLAYLLLQTSSIQLKAEPFTEKTQILWDEWGVPHIYADNPEHLFYAQGWAEMQLHSNEILKIYGKARGKAAEYWGKDYLQQDLLIHRFGFPEKAMEYEEQQNPEQRKLAHAFIDGMNRYAVEHPESIEKENRVVLPFKYEDAAMLALYVIWIKWSGAEDIWQINESPAGSNALAVGPSRSASGHAMLVQNPHNPWHDEYLFIEMHLNCPGANIYGSVIVGMPALTIAFNESLGWTFTVNTLDNFDTYKDTRSGSGYLLDGKVTAFQTRTKTLNIKQADGTLQPYSFDINQTAQGPVLKEDSNFVYAARIPERSMTNLLWQTWKMGTATTFDEFESAVKMLQLPFLNILYADAAGNIFYLFNGFVPKRNKGDFAYWNRIIPGGKSEDIWTGIHPYEDLPKLKNPSTGWLQNTNDPPWSCTYPFQLKQKDYPAYFAPSGMDLRTEQAIRLMSQDSSISFDELIQYKMSTHIEMADRLMDELSDIVEKYGSDSAKYALNILKKWDRNADNTSVGTEIFLNWVYLMRLDAISHHGSFLATPWNINDPLNTPAGLRSPKNAEGYFEEAIKSVKQRFGSLTKPWGEMLRVRGGNNINLPGNGAPGLWGPLRVEEPAGGGPDDFYVAAGDSYVGIIEFGDKVKAKVLLSYGNSSQKDSPHNGDQLRLFSEKKLRDAWFYPEDVKKHIEKKEVLKGKDFVVAQQ